MNGCILILVALGLSIVFGLMGIINFAHGVFYMLGAYAGWLTVHLTGSFWLALAVAPVTVGLVGALVERGVLKRIYGTKNANFAGVLVTYGLAIMIPDLVRMTFGRPGKPFAVPAGADRLAVPARRHRGARLPRVHPARHRRAACRCCGSC